MKISALALSTFKEGIRDKTLLIVSLLGIFILISSLVFIPISIGESVRIVIDFGLSIIEIIILFQVIFIGTRIIYDEIVKKTIQTIFSKPIKPFEFMIGKYLGLLLICIVIQTILFVFFYFFLKIVFNFFFGRIFYWYYFLLFEIALIESVSLFLSTFLTPITSGIISLIIYFIANTSFYLKEFSLKVPNFLFKLFANFVYYIFPNFSLTNIKNLIVYSIQIEKNLFIFSFSYIVIYVILMLKLGSLIIEKKEFY